MDYSIVLARFFGILFVVLGLSLINRKSFKRVMDGLAANPSLLWGTGFVTSIIGAATVSLYDVWTADWNVAITLIGWLSVLKGAMLMLFPKFTMSLYGKLKSPGIYVFGGIVAFVVGVCLLYAGFFA